MDTKRKVPPGVRSKFQKLKEKHKKAGKKADWLESWERKYFNP